MADDPRGGRGYPPRENPNEPHYPPPPDDDDRRAHQQPSSASSNMTLPPFSSYQSSSQGYPPEPRYPPYPSDQRYPDPRYDSRGNWSESPTNQNGYSAPPRGYEPPPPPPHAARDRAPYERPPDGRGYDGRYDDRARYQDPYYQHHQSPPGRGAGYPPGQDPYGYGYRQPAAYPGGYHDYARGGPNAPPATAPPPPQAAPRQRTSIACRYCRKRKIRCSGYANTTNGKCSNCDKLRIDCVFQPVSSNSSTAFVPVSAVPGGVPPGTPLYGAYGQPLPPAPGQSQQGQPPPGQPRPYPPPTSDYAPSLHSPTTQYPPYEDRDRDAALRRRTRPAEEEHGIRLPPPNYPVDDDPRRRSPASTQSNGTPPTVYHQYQQSGYDQDRTPTPHRNSPGGPPPVSAPPPQSTSQSFGSRNPMSLNVLMRPDTDNRASGSDIDMSMKSKLDSRRA